MPAGDPPPKVMHLRSSCGFYGAEGVIYGLARAGGRACTTVCFEDALEPHTELCDALAAEGLPAERLPSRRAIDPAVPGRLRALIRRHRPTVLHAHELKSAVACVLAGRGLGLVFTVHGDLRETVAHPAMFRLGCWALSRFHAVAAVSDATVADARSFGVRPDRITLIRNGVDTGRFRPTADRAAARSALGVPPDGFLVGAVGRLSEEKGHAVLLDAFARLLRSQPDARLALAGDGPLLDALQAQACRLGVDARVAFLGRREDVPAVYSALDALAQPSHREGLPLTVAEAAASGLPVVATSVGDVARVVLDGETGLLVPANDPDAMAAALARLAAEPGLRARFGAAGRAHAEKHFSLRSVVDAYGALYRKAAEAAR